MATSSGFLNDSADKHELELAAERTARRAKVLHLMMGGSAATKITVSAVIGFANSVLIRLTFKETAETALSSKAAEGATSGRALIANPLGFLKLFRHGRALSMLTLSSGVQSMCEFGPHGIDRHFASEAAGMTNSMEGFYSSLRGLTMILGGKLVQPLAVRTKTKTFRMR